MRKVIVSTLLSLDGVMQAPGDPEEDKSEGVEHGGWQRPYFGKSQEVSSPTPWLHRTVSCWVERPTSTSLLSGRPRLMTSRSQPR